MTVRALHIALSFVLAKSSFLFTVYATTNFPLLFVYVEWLHAVLPNWKKSLLVPHCSLMYLRIWFVFCRWVIFEWTMGFLFFLAWSLMAFCLFPLIRLFMVLLFVLCCFVLVFCIFVRLEGCWVHWCSWYLPYLIGSCKVVVVLVLSYMMKKLWCEMEFDLSFRC